MEKEKYYNVAKPDIDKIHPVGTTVRFSSKTGGGSYVVVGHINCERCETIVEDREWQEPSRRHKKKLTYYPHYYWCFHCGFYKHEGSKESTQK